MIRRSCCAGVLLLALFAPAQVEAQVLPHPFELIHTNKNLRGQVVDFTNNHGHDRRLWSKALGEKRDLYVYLPPGYDPQKRYAFGIFLHGASQDERIFLKVVDLFDQAIACGQLPPVILAVPDGSLQRRPSYWYTASFFANTRAGDFEDFVMCDVWNHVATTFPIRPEREAHALIGVSMGGSAAFSMAIKYRARVKTALGFVPALNLRWVDCHGKYESNFDPDCWGWRAKPRPLEVFGRPYPFIKYRFHTLFAPITGYGPQAIAELSRINPAEIMEQYDLRPGQLDLYIAYAGKDQFNIQAQVESFLFLAKQRGLDISVDYDPQGRHDLETGVRMLPNALKWVAPRVPPPSPLP